MRAGLETVLVLTGTCTADDVAASAVQPDIVLPDLAALSTNRRRLVPTSKAHAPESDVLNAWLNEHHFATPPVEFDLGASTGPGLDVERPARIRRAGRASAAVRPVDLVCPQPRHPRPQDGDCRPRVSGAGTGAGDDGGAGALDPVPARSGAVRERRRSRAPQLPHVQRGAERPGHGEFATIGFGAKTSIASTSVRSESSSTGTQAPGGQQAAQPNRSGGHRVQLAEIHRLTVERGVQLVVDEVFHRSTTGRRVASAAQLPGQLSSAISRRPCA